ncbi:MAG: signal peptidase II [Nanoarchaeota archaeon]|nr:signal peptidase II [Nanoarchaeota archaeon]
MRKLFFYALALILLDQITKYLMQGKSFFSGFFSLNYVVNKGAAFGLLQGGRWFFIITAIIVIAYILVEYKKIKHKFGLVLLFAGSLSNCFDRLFLGYVRDFISIKYFSTFNFADIFNVLGVGLIFYFYIKGIYPKKLKEKA